MVLSFEKYCYRQYFEVWTLQYYCRTKWSQRCEVFCKPRQISRSI